MVMNASKGLKQVFYFADIEQNQRISVCNTGYYKKSIKEKPIECTTVAVLNWLIYTRFCKMFLV
jgi:hypothetical protein